MKVGFSTSLVLLWILPLISFLAMVSYGDVDKNLNIIVKDDQVETEEARIETFEVDGHVIDCIDMNKQPAFDNPLLINHTIQMEPTNYPEKTRENNSVVRDSQPWYLPKSCPKGSIPIWRAKRIEHSRDHNASNIGHDSYEDSASGVYELSDVFFHGRKYNGAKATINVWRPEVETNVEQSGAEIWISSNDKKTQLRAGWLVSPNINGDEKTRFFVGGLISSAGGICYNYACRGFVQTNPRSILQTYLKPVSVYGGQQYAADVEIFMDERTRNWWVRLQGVSMGYFPEELVPALDRGADFLAFGGHVYNAKPHGQHTITQMGSGHFSQEGFKKAGFFKEIKVLFHAAGGYGDPSDADISEVHTDHPNCYDLQAPEREGGYGSWGYYFFYGGPGRSAKCI